MKRKIVFVTTGLRAGGAEMMLFKLLAKIDRERFDPIVISLEDEGVFSELFDGIAIPVYCLNWRRGRIPWTGGVTLVRKLREIGPQIVQGWMYHGNVAAWLATKWGMRDVPVIWGIRGTHIDLKRESWLSAFVIWISARLSKCPRRIVNNSHKSVSLHAERLGYAIENSVVIPNGFDTDLFVPSVTARLALRKELGLQNDVRLIALIARFHQMKNHSGFLRAARTLRSKSPNVRFVMIGERIDSGNKVLVNEISALSLGEDVFLLGKRDDMPEMVAAMDIVSVTSIYGEGFPNVIGEAMSCGVPCVATDVGDSKWIVGDCGITVPVDDDGALTSAWEEILGLSEEERTLLGVKARRRIEECFSIDQIARRYEEMYDAVLDVAVARE